MNDHETHLIHLAAALCTGDESELRIGIARALDAGLDAGSLREVIHTSYLFDGYPTALEGFRILSEVAGEPGSAADEFTYNDANLQLWRERGDKLCRIIYGSQFDKLRQRVKSFAPELSDAMMVEGYGKVLSRDGLTPVIRELCVVTILAVKLRKRQLLSHAIGALRLGASPQRLRSILDAVERFAGETVRERAAEVIETAIKKV